jgi:hypothetical protein
VGRRPTVTTDELTDYCELKDVAVSYGHPEVGFVTVDGGGVRRKFNNYRRFLELNELASLPDPAEVLKRAAVFRIQEEGEARTLDRAEFEEELDRFRDLIGV